MNKKGFTLVELLAVIVVIGILAIVVLPAFTEVYSSIKSSNRNAKIQEMEKAAEKYGSKIKDIVKNESEKSESKNYKINSDDETGAAFLIKKGLLASDVEAEPQIIDPADNTVMEGDIYLTYCKSKYDIEAHYVEKFLKNTKYYAGDYVSNNGKFYLVVITYNPNKLYDVSDGTCGDGSADANKFAKKNKSRYEKCIQQPLSSTMENVNDIKDIKNPFNQSFFEEYDCQETS